MKAKIVPLDRFASLTVLKAFVTNKEDNLVLMQELSEHRDMTVENILVVNLQEE